MTALKQKQSLRQSLSPQQVIQANILQLNISVLEKKILDELESNPLLEQSVTEDESVEAVDELEAEVEYDQDPDEYEPSNIYDNNNVQDREIPVKDQLDFIEGLIQQLDAYKFKNWQREIAEEILWNLDENGYLVVDLVLIADRYERTDKEVLSILEKIHQLDPPGIAARNLQECLKIQMIDKQNTTAYHIVMNYFDDFANHRYEKIKKELNIDDSTLSRVIDEIAKLDPHPGKGKIGEESETVIPDLLVVQQEGKWKMIINDFTIPELSISNEYVTMLDKTDISSDTKKYLKEKFDSASWFIQAIQQRHDTLSKVMKSIIERQTNFFEGETNNLIPMKLQDIADDIKMDISTISRSTRGKYVDTPYGIFELKSFFTDGYIINSGEEVSTNTIKDLLKQLIDEEDKKSPLTDTNLTKELNVMGYPVARRTVAKYREQLHLPVARLRRQLTH